MVTCVGNLPRFIAFSFYCGLYSNLKLLIFHLLVLIMDAGYQHTFKIWETSVQRSKHIQNGTELYIVQLMKMDCLNKINLWMTENLF